MRVKLLPKFESGAVARISGPNEKKNSSCCRFARPATENKAKAETQHNKTTDPW